MNTEKSDFHSELKRLMDEYVNKVYDYSVSFPKDEIFGFTSQLKRASLSVPLNYIEGYARRKKLVFKNFIEISYGSLQESRYLVEFIYKRKHPNKGQFSVLDELANKIGGMLWGILTKLEN